MEVTETSLVKKVWKLADVMAGAGIGFTGTTGRHQRPDRTGHHVGQNVVQRWRRCCERLQNIDRLMGSH